MTGDHSLAVLHGAALAILLAGCAATPSGPGAPASAHPTVRSDVAAQSPRVANRNLSGYSPAFRQGYLEGCQSAGGNRQRDEGRYKADTDYVMGWNDGYSVCRR